MKKKTGYLVSRKGKSVMVDSCVLSNVPNRYKKDWSKLCLIFSTKFGAQDWIEMWNNKEDFMIEEIQLPHNKES